MAQEMSPALYANHAGIKVSMVEDWIQGSGSILFDPRDIRQIHGRLTLIAVQAPNASGQGARPRFIPNPAYKYERKRKSIHESRGAGPVKVVPVQGAGIQSVSHPTTQDVQWNAALGVVGREGVSEALEVANRKARAHHA